MLCCLCLSTLHSTIYVKLTLQKQCTLFYCGLLQLRDSKVKCPRPHPGCLSLAQGSQGPEQFSGHPTGRQLTSPDSLPRKRPLTSLVILARVSGLNLIGPACIMWQSETNHLHRENGLCWLVQPRSWAHMWNQGMELGSLKQMDLGWRRVIFSRETEIRLLGKNARPALGAGQSSRCCYVLMTHIGC